MNNASRAVAKLSAYGLLLTAIVLAYLNTTTNAFVWSTIYIAGLVVCTLAAAAKLASAEGIDSKVLEVADHIASVVPFVAITACVYQGLHYMQPGNSGFFAGIAIIAAVFNIFFGLWDSLSGWVGDKYAAASDFVKRAERASDVLFNGRDERP